MNMKEFNPKRDLGSEKAGARLRGLPEPAPARGGAGLRRHYYGQPVWDVAQPSGTTQGLGYTQQVPVSGLVA